MHVYIFLSHPLPPPPPQTQDILDSRQEEELNFALSISVYDIDRNETARQHKQEMVSKAALVDVDVPKCCDPTPSPLPLPGATAGRRGAHPQGEGDGLFGSLPGPHRGPTSPHPEADGGCNTGGSNLHIFVPGIHVHTSSMQAAHTHGHT